MIIRLSETEMTALEGIVKHFDGNITSNRLMKVLKYDATEDKAGYFELKIRKSYTEPVMTAVAKYAGFAVPVVKGLITMGKSLIKDIEDVETAIIHADDTKDAKAEPNETAQPLNTREE